MFAQQNEYMKYVYVKARGFTFIEAIVSLLVLAILTIGLFTSLSFVSGSAQRAKKETEGNMRVVKIIELINQYPYKMVVTNYFPVEYVTDNSGTLIYALTTTISEVSSPTLHKNIWIDHTWREGDVQKHKRYYYVKPE